MNFFVSMRIYELFAVYNKLCSKVTLSSCYFTCSQGANKDLRDIYNSTPIDYAIERGHDECVAILQSKPILTNNSAAVLDVHGHVQIKIPKRNFSLTETFIDRLPADGQAQSEVYIQDDLQPQEVNEEEQWCREQNKNNRTQVTVTSFSILIIIIKDSCLHYTWK